MKKMKLFVTIIFIVLLVLNVSGVETTSAKKILDGFVDSFRQKILENDDIVFTFRVTDVTGAIWTVRVGPEKQIKVEKGQSDDSVFIIYADHLTWKKVHNGEMSILTSMGKARYKDKAPMEVDGIEGPQSVKLKHWNMMSFLFRFFTRGYPEIIHCSGERSRLVHGGNVVGLFYTPGLRTAWYQVTKGMVINKDPKDQVNVFDTIIFCVSGEGIAILDGKPYTIKKNMMVMIPKGMRHSFKNEKDEPCEFIIIMFGEQA